MAAEALVLGVLQAQRGLQACPRASGNLEGERRCDSNVGELQLSLVLHSRGVGGALEILTVSRANGAGG